MARHQPPLPELTRARAVRHCRIETKVALAMLQSEEKSLLDTVKTRTGQPSVNAELHAAPGGTTLRRPEARAPITVGCLLATTNWLLKVWARRQPLLTGSNS
jgi:hypothetical protein